MPRRVLAIDDSATLRAIVREVLTEAGYEVETAVDGAEGLEIVQRQGFDLVLVDFVMPRLNGYQFAQAFRSLPAMGATPMILLSAKAEQIGERFCAQTGAVAALSKPFTPGQLVTLVQSALGETQQFQSPLKSLSPDPMIAMASSAMPTVGPPPRTGMPSGVSAMRLSVPAPDDPERPGGRVSISTRELRPPLTPRHGLGQVVAAAMGASASAEPLFGREEAEGFLSWLDDEEGGTREEAPVYELSARPSQPLRPPSRMSWPPDSVFKVPELPSLTESREHAHERFATALGRAIMPVLTDLAATGGNVSEETVSQVLRFYLSQHAVSALARELRLLDPNLRGAIALEGNLAAVPLGEVFQLMALQSQTGLLVIERAGKAPTPTVTVALRQGRIEQCFSQNLGAEFLLGRYLVAHAAVPREEIEGHVVTARSRKVPLGASMVAAGHLRPADLERCLTQQTSELIFEVLRWSAGRFHFEAGASAPEADAARLSIMSEALILEAFRRLDEWRLIGEYIASERVVFAADPLALQAHGRERLSRDEVRVFEALDGKRSVRELVRLLAMNSFDASKVLYRLVRARLVVQVGG